MACDRAGRGRRRRAQLFTGGGGTGAETNTVESAHRRLKEFLRRPGELALTWLVYGCSLIVSQRSVWPEPDVPALGEQ